MVEARSPVACAMDVSIGSQIDVFLDLLGVQEDANPGLLMIAMMFV